MQVLIIGAAGMLGRKLSERLTRDGSLGKRPISELVRADIAGGAGVIATDLSAPGVAADLIGSRPEIIFDLAAVVSGEAETNFAKGYRVNVDAARHLLEAIRLAGPGYAPRLVFCSSIAVFGPPMPDVIPDDHPTTPATSYGTQKAIVELLLADYTRRELLDGVAIRLPTICVRPGAPNLAASGFFSNIIREPLHGRPAVAFLIHAATMDTRLLGLRRALTMPGLSATVAEQIEALRRAAGDDAVALIRAEPDEAIARMVASWPRGFDARRATELGFTAERDFDEIVRVYVEDEMGGAPR